MKVTAIIPDNIVKEVQKYAGGKTLTDSLIIALKEWLSLKHIKKLNQEIQASSLSFTENVSADNIRSINRK